MEFRDSWKDRDKGGSRCQATIFLHLHHEIMLCSLSEFLQVSQERVIVAVICAEAMKQSDFKSPLE